MPVPEPDVWGLAFRRIHEGSLNSAVLRRDDGWAEDVPEMLASYFGPPEPHQVELLSRLSGRVLDVGCGVGRHLLWLQEHGIEAVGIDHSPGAIEVCRQRGCRDVHVGAPADLEFPEDHFDAAIMFGNNAGIGGTAEGCEEIFRRLARWVRPGGLLIAEGREAAVANSPGHAEYDAAGQLAGHPAGQVRWRLECCGEIGDWFTLMLFDPEELERLLPPTGWKVQCCTPHQPSLFVVVAEAAQ